jgi:predicted SAM-dependent methyltransferase
MWHVLEHVYHLNEDLAEMNRVLKKSGLLIIAVPNMDSYDAKKYGAYWAAFDVPRHLYHFQKNTIQQLLEKHHFSLLEILPMKFDSFYVSMLSEKYKGSNFKNIPESYLSWCIENETPQYKEMKKYLELKAEKNNFNEFDINLIKLEVKK